MAGKNTAVFGIYRDQMSVENAVDAFAGWLPVTLISQFCSREGGTKTSLTKKTLKPRGCDRRRYLRRSDRWRLGGWQVLAHCYPRLDRLSPLVPSSRRWLALVPVELWRIHRGVGWHGHSRVRSQTLRRSNQEEAFCSRYIRRLQLTRRAKEIWTDRRAGCFFHCEAKADWQKTDKPCLAPVNAEVQARQ